MAVAQCNTSAGIREILQLNRLDWISASKSSDVRKLQHQAEIKSRPLWPNPDQVAEMSNPEFPGERLLACLNPRIRTERTRKHSTSRLETANSYCRTIYTALNKKKLERESM